MEIAATDYVVVDAHVFVRLWCVALNLHTRIAPSREPKWHKPFGANGLHTRVRPNALDQMIKIKRALRPGVVGSPQIKRSNRHMTRIEARTLVLGVVQASQQKTGAHQQNSRK